jgi:hypothetical protein
MDAAAAAQDAEARRKREASYNTVKTFAECYLRERGLRPTTVHNYQGLLVTRINPYFGEMPLKNVTLSEIKAWRASLNPKTEATNAAAYRLLRSLLQAAEEEELIDHAAEDPRSGLRAGQARRRAGHPRRDRGHHRRIARTPAVPRRPRRVRWAAPR